jgi:ATP-dependent Clp protease ATP-binding subunit ClpA
VAPKALESLGISLEDARHQVEEIIGQGKAFPSGHIPFTPRAKKVLELALREALDLGHNYIGTEHILLGLVREGEGVAAQVLQKLGADLGRVREQVIQLLSGYTGGREGSPGPHEERAGLSEAIRGLRSRRTGVERLHETPLCPRCAAELSETASVRTFDVSVHGAQEERAVAFVFCTKCGTWLGTV